MVYQANLRLILIISWAIALVSPFLFLFLLPNYYVFNVHALGNLLASYFIGALGIAIAGKELADKQRFYLFLLSLSLFLWLWAEGLGYLCRRDQPELAMSWFRTANMGVIFIAAHVYAFTANFLRLERKKTILLGYGIGIVFVLLSTFTDYFVGSVRLFRWGYYPQWNFLNTTPYFLFFSIYLSLALLEYFKAWRNSISRHFQSQVTYLMFAFATSYIGSIDYLPAFGYDVYPLGYIAVMGWWSILAYAILKHRLMDITIIIRKTLVYSVVMGSLTCVYLGTITLFAHVFEGFTGYQTVFSSAIAAGLITICFQPLRKKVQTFVDTKFFRQYVDREEKLYELSREVITHTTAEALAAALMRVLGDTFHPKNAGLYLKGRYTSSFSRMGAIGEETLPENMSSENALAAYFSDHSQPFVLDSSGQEATPRSTRTQRGGERPATDGSGAAA